MAGDGCQRRHHHPINPRRIERAEGNGVANEVCGEPDGKITLSGVEEQRHRTCAEADGARNVRGCDVSAAYGADIASAAQFRNEEAERD